MSPRRRPLVAANWKMHLMRGEAELLARAVASAVTADGPEVVLFPSFPLLPAIASVLTGSPVELGGQDLHAEAAGAHTGDVSGEQLVDAGCAWVLVGHSERRRDHAETDSVVADKAVAAFRAGLRPILCFGETAAERAQGGTEAVLLRQVEALLVALADRRAEEFALAYEPVWAIGTGDTARPDQVQEAHALVRRRLQQALGEAVAAPVRVLYGGSVKPENAAELAAEPDVDGFLVGGASLDAEKFLAIMARSASLGGSAPRRRHP
ncbi:MAG: triose-phosphate isomerase [Thermoanaerobaculia bacterium]|nr:triose-phosphate isomerase [Thermoanaerobaculia bacterium]